MLVAKTRHGARVAQPGHQLLGGGSDDGGQRGAGMAQVVEVEIGSPDLRTRRRPRLLQHVHPQWSALHTVEQQQGCPGTDGARPRRRLWRVP